MINEIQKIYQSQKIQIHNKHIKIIIHQITSKILISKKKISNIFLPKKLIKLLQTKQTKHTLKKTIYYQTILLKITQTSLNTQNFISKTNFQKTTQILTKTTLQNHIN